MTEQELFNVLERYGQQHLLVHYHTLSRHQKDAVLRTALSLDIHLTFKLYMEFCLGKDAGHTTAAIKPSDIIGIPVNTQEKRMAEQARLLGESLLRKGRVAVLIVAGGQGSRLGFEGPKGTFALSPVRKKSLFQLFSEQVKALSTRYGATMPLLIMTSNDNHSDTIDFFTKNRYFGLPPETVHFFSQGVLPAVSQDGKLVLKDSAHLYTSPNGHGGSLKAISDSGVLAKLIASGCEELFYCQVDNPLVKIADPVFLGYHAMARSQASTKVVRRRSIEEKVGVYLDLNGKDTVIEYSDIDADHMSALDERGEILYWAGNTAIHIFSLSFIEELNRDGFALPYHCAQKTAYVISSDWEPASIDVWKFETFVFDAIPLAGKTCCMEVPREEEFAPVKNKDGVDSPETARQAMSEQHRKWLERAGIETPPGTKVEISPLFALDADEFISKTRGKKITVSSEIYIE